MTKAATAVEPAASGMSLMGLSMGSTPAAPQAAVGRTVTFDTPSGRPEERQTKDTAFAGHGAGKGNVTSLPRPFKPADIGLIRSLHNTMPAAQLLRVLNNRLMADIGADAPLYTMKMLTDQIGELIGSHEVIGVSGWADIRKLIAQAAKDGTLARCTEQTIHDFAVVFQLNEKQFIHLKEVLLSATEEDDEE